MSATHIPIALRRQVRERARERCEYCLIPESMTWATHTIDHIIAEKHGGGTAADNRPHYRRKARWRYCG